MATTIKPNDWLTTKELQEYVIQKGRHWSRTNIQYLITNKKLPSSKIGMTLIFLKKDVDDYLKSLTRKAPPLMVKKELDN